VTRVLWTPQAIADLEAIQDFIARDSQHYAEVVVDRVLTAVERLRTSHGLVVWCPKCAARTFGR
jgi:plasmid stabilization system protein ParE